VQIENAMALFFERGSQLALVRGTAGARTVLRGEPSIFGARLCFASAPQINYVGHRPLPRPSPDASAFLIFAVCVNSKDITDNNLIRKGQFARICLVVL
jgi:hypothetical protein